MTKKIWTMFILVLCAAICLVMTCLGIVICIEMLVVNNLSTFIPATIAVIMVGLLALWYITSAAKAVTVK